MRNRRLAPTLNRFRLTKVPVQPVAPLMLARRHRPIQRPALQLRRRLLRKGHLHLPRRPPPSLRLPNIDSATILVMAIARPQPRRIRARTARTIPMESIDGIAALTYFESSSCQPRRS